MKNKILKILPLLLFLLLIIYYFEYSITILWDSAHYMSYVNILEGILPFSSWDVVRGPIFPLIIHFGNIIFGKTTQGLIMNTFAYYLIMLLFVYKILCYYFDYLNYDKKKKQKLIIVIILTIIFNPIIYGFYHSLLTEFVAITISVVSCYLAVIWLDIDYSKNKNKYILISILFIFFTIISWFLKQPYASCGIFPFLISYIISVFQERKLKKIVIRTCTLLLSIACLVLSITIWNKILIKFGADPTTDRNPTVSFGNTLINGLYFLKIDNSSEVKNEKYINDNLYITQNEKDNILEKIKNNEEYVLINIYDENEKIIEIDYISTADNNISISSAITYIIKCLFKYPSKVLDAYVTNYLSIIDIYSTNTTNGVEYSSNKKIDLKFSNEISSIANRPYYYGASNIFDMLPEMKERVVLYKQDNYVMKPINYAMIILSKIFLVIFKLSFLILPILFFVSIFARIFCVKINSNKKVLNLIIIMLGYSFLHIMLHTVTGAIIDRYAIPAFISTYLSIIISVFIFISYLKNKKVKKNTLAK